MARKTKDYTNRQYGKLLLLCYSRPGGTGSGAIWKAACECGTILEVVAKDVAAGKKRTCGRCFSRLGISGPEGVVAAGIPIGHRRPFRAMVRDARNMPGGVGFTTTDYNRIRKLRCIGCNTRDVHVEWDRAGGTATPDNMCPICRRCSRRRMGDSVREWLEDTMRVARSIMQRANSQSE